MGRSTQKLKRVQIDMSEAAFDRLQRLQEETGAISIAEVIRDAIRLKEAIVELRTSGKEIFVEDRDTAKKVPLFLVDKPIS